jgi:hypothetical protein
MPRNRKPPPKPERIITVRAIRRDPPDLKLLSRAFIALDQQLQRQQRAAADAPPPDPPT